MTGIDKRILVIDDSITDKKTATGLFIPEIALTDKEILTGTIYSSYDNCEVQPGDRVKYTKFAGTLIEDDDSTKVYRVCRINDLLVKL